MKRIALVTDAPDQLTDLFEELGVRGWSCIVVDPRDGIMQSHADDLFVVSILMPKVLPNHNTATLLLSKQDEELRLHNTTGIRVSVQQLANTIEQLATPAKPSQHEDALSHMADWDAAI